MIWRSTAQIVLSFLVAGITVWFSPLLLEPLRLGEFVFLGQLGLVIVALSLLETLYRRLPGSPDH